MRKLPSIILPTMLFLLSGCAQYWYQEGKTFEQCQQDRAACFTELQKHSDFTGPIYDYEYKFMDNCMQEKGYRLVSGSELPLDVKRQEPESSMHWRARGIAGQLPLQNK